MTTILILGIILILLGAGAYLYSKRPARFTKNIKHAAVQDPEAEALYKQSKTPQKKPLSLAERIELSWQFLYDITDKVLNTFSAADRKATTQLGHTLSEAGMKYQHVVDLGIRSELSRSRTGGQDKAQEQSAKVTQR